MLTRPAVLYGRKLRANKWRLYCEMFPPRLGESVLDVGTSADYNFEPNANYFLHRYPHPEQLTAVGIEDVSKLRSSYPLVTFVQADGRSLPFPDDSFDVVHSNAVIEHIPYSDQQAFVSELVRVARAGMLTTPNRWFPLDPHTRLPFLHWLPRPLMLRANSLARHPEAGVWPISPRQLKRLFPPTTRMVVVPQRIAGMRATLTVIFFSEGS